MPRLLKISMCAGLVLMLLATSAMGAGYPQPVNNYINDFAGVLNPADTRQLRNSLEKLEREKGIEGTVVTIQRITDYGTGDGSIEAFATNLFNTWGVGDKSNNNGFMVLVAVGDRRSRIELGRGWAGGHDSEMQEIINEQMIPRFKSGDYNGAISNGTNAVIAALSTRPLLAQSTQNAQPAAARPRPPVGQAPNVQGTNTAPPLPQNVRAQPVGASTRIVFIPYLVIAVVAIVLVFLFKPLTSAGDPNQHGANPSSHYTHFDGSGGGGSGGSGGSGGFGGGSSSGGGASGSW